MQIKNRSSRRVQNMVIVALSSFVLGSALLVQPLGLWPSWQDTRTTMSDAAVQPSASQSGPDFTAMESFSLNPELYNRSNSGMYETMPTYDPDIEGPFDGDYDPDADWEDMPDGYDPVDGPDGDAPADEPLEPIVKPKGLMYTDADYVLYIKANTLNLRAGPSTDATIVATLKFGDKVICEGENDDWMKVRYDGQLGFLKTEYTSRTMVFRQVNETVYVKATSLNLRSEPSTDSAIIIKLGKNDRLTRTGIGDEWSRVKTASGKTGYVASEYLTTTAPARASSGSSSVPAIRDSGTVSGDAGRIVELAYQALGVRYVHAEESLSRGFDCTGLTYWAYKQIGITTPRVTSGYYSAGVGVAYANIRPGDVLAMDTRSRDGKTSITHVGIYVGNGMMIHASSRLGKVVLQDVRQYLSWGVKLITVRRFVNG